MIKQTTLKSGNGELYSFLEESDWSPYINNYVSIYIYFNDNSLMCYSFEVLLRYYSKIQFISTLSKFIHIRILRWIIIKSYRYKGFI